LEVLLIAKFPCGVKNKGAKLVVKQWDWMFGFWKETIGTGELIVGFWEEIEGVWKTFIGLWNKTITVGGQSPKNQTKKAA